MDSFTIGQHVSYDNIQGYVTFISERYITVCIREYQKPPELAVNSRQQLNQVCVCVFSEDWKDVVLTDAK